MEGFELINKYNERCLQWRGECSRLLSEWAMTNDEADARFERETWVIAGFLCISNNKVRSMLEAVATTRIEHVVLTLRYLRDHLSPKKAACQFCTRFTETGEHVAACLGEAPQCSYTHESSIGNLRCQLPTGHLGHHRHSSAKHTEASK